MWLQIFSWRLLSGEFVWLDIVSPRARVTRARHRLLRRVSRAPPKSPTTLLLEKFGVHVVDDDAGRAPPHLELVLPENPDAVRFGDAVTVFPFTLEQVRCCPGSSGSCCVNSLPVLGVGGLCDGQQTANVFYRKFKEPLPDPSSPQLVAITVLDEHRFEEFDAVFRRRKIQFKYVALSDDGCVASGSKSDVAGACCRVRRVGTMPRTSSSASSPPASLSSTLRTRSWISATAYVYAAELSCSPAGDGVGASQWTPADFLRVHEERVVPVVRDHRGLCSLPCDWRRWRVVRA